VVTLIVSQISAWSHGGRQMARLMHLVIQLSYRLWCEYGHNVELPFGNTFM
jgi:hypothetical protein